MRHAAAQLTYGAVAALQSAHVARVDGPHGEAAVCVELAAALANGETTHALRARDLRDAQGQRVERHLAHVLARRRVLGYRRWIVHGHLLWWKREGVCYWEIILHS